MHRCLIAPFQLGREVPELLHLSESQVCPEAESQAADHDALGAVAVLVLHHATGERHPPRHPAFLASTGARQRQVPGPLSARQIADWIDHDEDNLWVLCDVHHRARFFGVHQITVPVWGPQHILKDEFIARVQAEIAKQKLNNKGNRR